MKCVCVCLHVGTRSVNVIANFKKTYFVKPSVFQCPNYLTVHKSHQIDYLMVTTDLECFDSMSSLLRWGNKIWLCLVICSKSQSQIVIETRLKLQALDFQSRVIAIPTNLGLTLYFPLLSLCFFHGMPSFNSVPLDQCLQNLILLKHKKIQRIF